MNIKDIFKKFVDVGNNADPTGTAGYMVDDISTANLSAANNAAAQTQKTVDSIKQSTSSILGGAPKLSLGGKTFGATPTVTSPLKQTTPIIPPKSTVSKKPVTPTYRVDPKERPKLELNRNADKDKKDVKIPEIRAFGAGDTKFTPDEPFKPLAPVSYYGAGSATQDIVTGKKKETKSYSAGANKGNSDTSAYFSAKRPEVHGAEPIVAGLKPNAGGTEDMLFPTAQANDAYASRKIDPKYGLGNIDLTNRNTGLYDKDGKIMTVDSFSFEEDGKEILVPKVVYRNGKWEHLTEDQAREHYHITGEYLGKFDTPEEANAYANQLHLDQEKLYGDQVSPERKALQDERAELVKKAAELSMYGAEYAEDIQSLTDQINAIDAQLAGDEEAVNPSMNSQFFGGGATELRDLSKEQAEFDAAFEEAYNVLMDDPYHAKMLQNIRNYTYKVAGGADLDLSKDFREEYTAAHDAFEKEREKVIELYGEASPEIKAFDKFMQEYEDLGRAVEVKEARKTSARYSTMLDENLLAIYGGLMETDAYQAAIEKGRKALSKMQGGDTRFEQEFGRASELQQEFLLYLLGTGGFEAVKQFRASEVGQLLTASLAGSIYADQIENDSSLWRGLAIGGNTALTGMEHTFTGAEAFYKGATGKDKDDPTDMDLGGGYTISDATDNYLKQTLIGDMESDQFNMFSELGSSALATAASGTDWYKAFNKDASEYQKKAMGLLYYAFTSEYGSYQMAPADALAAIEEVWKGVGDYKQALWDSVKKGSNRVPVSGNDMLYSLYDEYLKLGDTELGGFFNKLSNGEVGAAQMLHQAGMTMSEQIIPMLMSMGVGGAFKALGAGKKATTWASRLASGLPMAMSIGGRSYTSALDEGADRAHALGYGISDAALEFVVGWFLDGAAGVGGKLTGGLRDKVIAKIASPLGRALADAGIRSFGEGLEEYIQEALAPVVDLWINEGSLGEALGEAFDPDNILDPDRLYAGFLGAFSALAMSPGNVAADIRNNAYYQAYGDAMKKADGLKKAADLILHNKPSGSDSDSEAYEAAKSTAEIIDKGGSVSDLAAGKMVADFAASGGDASMLANPATLSYTKESITEDDYAVGVASELLTLGEESGEETMQLAKDIAKLATGQEISAEAQARIDSNPNAQTVLEQINGDLDMSDNNNALTRAARMSVISGYNAKLSEAVQRFNTDKTIVTPTVQTLIESGVEVKEAQKIGAVINKVLDGQTLTEKDAKLIDAKNAAVRSTILAATGLNLTEYATPKMVMDVLNGFAKDVVRLKDSQAAVKKGAKQAAQARGAAMQGGIANGIQGNDTGPAVQGPERSGQEGPQGAGAAVGGPAGAGQAPADLGRSGQRSGQDQRNAGQVQPEVNQEQQQEVKAKCVEAGADTVEFVTDEDSCCFYDPTRGYVIQIKTNGQFTIEQYGEHEPIHLWITHALSEDHRRDVLDAFGVEFIDRFGEDFYNKLYSFIEQVYKDKGYLPTNKDAAEYQILEDMLAFCYAGQDYGMDLTACRQFARQFVEDHGLKAIGTGDFNSPKVQEALANGWINQEYYDRHGWSEEDDGTTIDISFSEEAPAEQTQQEEAKPEKATNEFENRGRLDALKKMRKNLAKQRKLLVDRAKTTGDNKKSSPNYEAHRAKVDAIDEQLKVYDKRIAELENKQHSADYDPEYYQSIGLIDTDGSTASFTDNINGVHEDIINQLNGHPGEDVTDFIARGGVRVKPNYGIEINGKTALTAAQYDMIENIVANFSGDTFGIDFVIDGAHMNPEVFEGADIDPNRVRSFLRNYYERRKANKARDEKLEHYGDILGMPVKTMEDAYNLAQMMIQMEGPDPELQEIVDTYDQRRFSADYADDVYNELVGNGYYSVNTPELDKMAEDFDTAWIVSTGEIEDVKAWDKYHAEDGATDLQDNPITNDVQKFFAAAQSFGRALGDLLPGITPLFLATDYLGFSAYDPAGKSDDHRSIFLTDDYTVGTTYSHGKNSIDMKALGAMREHIARELGYKNFEDLPLPTELWNNNDYETLAKMYNAALSFKGRTRWVDRNGLTPLQTEYDGDEFWRQLYENRENILKGFSESANKLPDIISFVKKLPGSISEEYKNYVADELENLQKNVERASGQFNKLVSNSELDKQGANKLKDILSDCDDDLMSVITDVYRFSKDDIDPALARYADSASSYLEDFRNDFLGDIGNALWRATTPRGFTDIYGDSVKSQDVLDTLASSGNWAVYANTTNPLVLYGGEQVWNHLEDLIDVDAGCEWADDFWEWYEQNPFKTSNYQVKTRHIANYAYERGYDSAIITDIYDIGNGGTWDDHRPSNIYVVFNPNQIKSVNNKHPSEDPRMNYSADYLDPNSEDYLGPELSSTVYENAAVDDAYRNKLWINEDEEATEEELSESSLDDDILDADLDMFLARLEAEKKAGNISEERMTELWDRYLEKQGGHINYTKNAPKNAPEKTEAKKKPVIPAAKTAEPKTAKPTQTSPEKPVLPPVKRAEPETAKPTQTSPEKPVIPAAKTVEPETAKPAQTSPEKSELAELAEKIAARPEDNPDPELLKQAVEAMNRGEAEYAKTLERTELAAQEIVQASEKLKKTEAEIEKKEQELAKPKHEAIVLKNDGTKFSKKDKNLNYARKIGKASSIEIRRRRSDRNTFDVRFNDGTGKIVAYEGVSPSALIKAFAYATGDKETAKQRAGQAMALASEPSLTWNIVKNEKIEKAPYVKPEEVRDRDNYGRRVPVKLTEFLKNSAIRTDKGALINVYRLAPANGVHNNKLNNKLSIYTERAAPINTMRGMTGAAAFGQTGKGVSEQLAEWLRMAADPEISPKELEKIRQRIVAVEKLMREYTNGVTRLDSNRPGFEFATPENAVNGKTLVEAYLDIRKPKVIDAKGKGVDFIRSEVQKFIRDPANKAGLFDANKNPVGPHDGFKFLNVRVMPEGETLGGGEADLDTAYVTLRNNQAKSTYNTAPTDSDFIQYSADYDNAMVEEADMLNQGILEKRGEGYSDDHGNWISPEQANFFENAKMLDQDGDVKYGIIPLFHGGRTIYFHFDKNKATNPWFYLTTNPRVAGGYTDGSPTETTDLIKREGIFRKAARAMGVKNPQLAIKTLISQIQQGQTEDQNQAAEKYANLLTEFIRDGGYLYDKDTRKYDTAITQIKAIPTKGDDLRLRNIERLSNSIDDQLDLLGDKMADLEGSIDEYKDKPERSDMMRLHDVLDELYLAAQGVVSAAKNGDSEEATNNFNQLRTMSMSLGAPITSQETGEILYEASDFSEVTDAIRKLAYELNTIVDRPADAQPRFEVVYKDGGSEIMGVKELPSIAARGGVTAFYANITNPLVVDGSDRDGKTGHWTTVDTSRNPELYQEFPDGYAETDEIAEYAKDAGYDGVIIHNIYDTATANNEPGWEGDDYIVFDSSRIKSVNNRTPTEDPRFNHSADYADADTGYTEGTLEDTILKIMADKDEDRALAALAEYFSTFLQTGVLPEMEDEKTPNVFQPRVSASQRQILEDRLRQDIDKYGRLEPGENPARNVFFPKRTDEGYVPRTYRTSAESKNIPERTVPAIMREIVQNGTNGKEVVYQRITDKEAIAFADREMRKRGFDALLTEWQGKRDNEKQATKHDIAVAELVMIEAAKAGDVNTTLSVMAELAEAATTAGQVVQAMRLIKSMPASYQLYYFQRVVNRLNRQYSKMINSKKMDEIKIDRDKAKAVIEAKTQEDLDKAVENLLQSVADQIPSTMQDKWNAWRYLAMLGNPKTHIRNLLGNTIFAPAKFAKNLIAAGLEGAVIKDPAQRNTSIKGLLGAPSEYRALAEDDYKGIRKDLQAGGKYNPMNEVMQKRKIFSDKTALGRSVEWLSKKNGELLELEDGLFLKRHYINALTNFLTTRGMSVAALKGTPEGARVMNEARQFAFNEALKATYRDASAIASALNNIKKSSGAAGVLLDGVLPFTKTPINILKRGLEYSPVGLLNAITVNGVKLKNGDIDVHQFIDTLSAGLTGTGVALIGYLLSSLGLLHGSDDDDDKKADADKLVGYQNYSIDIGGKNFTIDWAAPTALPLFVGNAVFNELGESNELSFNDVLNAITVVAEPLTQLSMLSGLNDAMKSAKWDENPLSSVAMSAASGYVSQALPTFFAQIARSIPKDRRTTYVDKNSDVSPAIQRWMQTNILGKTPGLNNKRTEYIDAWGRKDTDKNGFISRLFANMFAPWYTNNVNITAVDSELQRLSETTGTSVLMSPAERYIEFNNQKHNLTADQYQTYSKVRGEQTFSMLSELFNSYAYQNSMTEEEKAKAVGFIKQYGNVLGKQAVFPEYDPDEDNWAEKCDGDTSRVMTMALVKAQASEAGITVSNNGSFYNMVVNSSWMSPVDKAYVIAQQYDIGSTKEVYVSKKGPHYELTPERKNTLFEHYRMIFPGYYLELVQTQAWQNADAEKRLDMLADLRKQVNGINKAWLAEYLYSIGATQITG